MKERRKAISFLIPSFSGVLLFVLVPFMDAIRRSFFEAMSGRYVGFENYTTVVNNEAFRLAIKNTARFIAVCVPLLLLLSLTLSIMLFHVTELRDILKASFLLPMAIPVSSVVFLWKVVFHQDGLLNELLAHFGARGCDWITIRAFPVLVFSYIWKNIGYDMVLWLAGLNSIPTTLYEAASVDGANTWQSFRFITLPELIPTAFVISVLSILNTFKVFREAYLIAGAYPKDSNIYMLQHIFNNWFTSLDIQKMCAAAVIVAGAVVTVILLLQYLDKRLGDNS